MPEPIAATYVAAVPGLRWRAWPGEESAAVYVPSSGRTHWVTALGLAILEHTVARPLHLAALGEAIFSAELDVDGRQLPAREGAQDSVSDGLRESAQGLIQAGLLQVVQCPSH